MKSRWTFLAVALALVPLAAGCQPAAASQAPQSPAPVSSSPQPTETEQSGPQPALEVDLSAALAGNPLLGVAVTAHDVFASVAAGVMRVNPTTGKAALAVKTPTAPSGLVVLGSDLWAQFPSENVIRRIRLADFAVTGEVHLDSAMANVFAATPGWVWTIVDGGAQLVRINARTAVVAGKTALGPGGGRLHPLGLTAAGENVFAADMATGVMQVDKTGRVVRHWDVPWPACAVVAEQSGRHAWIYSCAEGKLGRLDTASGAIDPIVMVDDLVGAIFPANDGVWFTLAQGRSTANFVHANGSGAIDKRIDLHGFKLAAWNGPTMIWFGSPSGLTAYRADSFSH
jgi:hypothetical protein